MVPASYQRPTGFSWGYINAPSPPNFFGEDVNENDNGGGRRKEAKEGVMEMAEEATVD